MRYLLAIAFIFFIASTDAQRLKLFKPKQWYYHLDSLDVDADGYAGEYYLDSVFSKNPPIGYTATKPQLPELKDCNDLNWNVWTPLLYYFDNDGDGYGKDSVYVCSEFAPFGYSDNNADCNDGNNAVHPSATELFNNIDDNCDGNVDERFTLVKPLINSYCNELWQWDRGHFDIDIFSEPFSSNFLSLHPGGGTFNNALANIHRLGSGYGFTGCTPYPNSSRTCENTPSADCSGDGVGCYAHSFDFYGKTALYFGLHGLSLPVNINPYVSDWTAQRGYIDSVEAYGVNVPFLTFGTELAEPTWYANAYYFPNGGADYVIAFNRLTDSVHRNYPNLKTAIWCANIWAKKGNAKTYNDGIINNNADMLAFYGQTKDIVNRITVTNQNWTEQQAIDSVLTFPAWLDRWTNAVKTKFGNKKIALLTAGTNPAEAQLGTSFLGLMQTELQFISFQNDTDVIFSQEYRTRSYRLNSTALTNDVKLRQLRGKLYDGKRCIVNIDTGSHYVIALSTMDTAGHTVTEIVNFSSDYYTPSFPFTSIEGYYVNSVFDSPDAATYYTGTSVRPKSISIVTN